MPKIGKPDTSKNSPAKDDVDLLPGIAVDHSSPSALRTLAQKYLKQGDRKHLAAAVRLLSMAYERDRTDQRTLELWSFAFEKMRRQEQARKANAVRVDVPKEEPSRPSSPV
jgi:Flp pilus assembly protein TadD